VQSEIFLSFFVYSIEDTVVSSDVNSHLIASGQILSFTVFLIGLIAGMRIDVLMGQ